MKKTKSNHMKNVILHDPGANDARKCSECECRNNKGFCDNYFLYAVIRRICKIPVSEWYEELER